MCWVGVPIYPELMVTSMDIRCPSCSAEPGQSCHTPAGRVCGPHASRCDAARVLDQVPIPPAAVHVLVATQQSVTLRSAVPGRETRFTVGDVSNGYTFITVVLPDGDLRSITLPVGMAAEAVTRFAGPVTDVDGLRELGVFLDVCPAEPEGPDLIRSTMRDIADPMWDHRGTRSRAAVAVHDPQLRGMGVYGTGGCHVLDGELEPYPGAWPREALRAAVARRDYTTIWPYLAAHP